MRNLLLPLTAVVLLFATSAAAVPENWREDYMKHHDPLASRAIWDFDSAAARLNVVLLQMQQEGQLTPDAMHRIQAEVERIEHDYVASHFVTLPGVLSNYAAPYGPQTNSSYDAQYREATRASGNYGQQLPAPPVPPSAAPKK
jgi:hypothetical protein